MYADLMNLPRTSVFWILVNREDFSYDFFKVIFTQGWLQIPTISYLTMWPACFDLWFTILIPSLCSSGPTLTPLFGTCLRVFFVGAEIAVPSEEFIFLTMCRPLPFFQTRVLNVHWNTGFLLLLKEVERGKEFGHLFYASQRNFSRRFLGGAVFESKSSSPAITEIPVSRIYRRMILCPSTICLKKNKKGVTRLFF